MGLLRRLYSTVLVAFIARRSPEGERRLPPRFRRSFFWAVHRIEGPQAKPSRPSAGLEGVKVSASWDGVDDPAYLLAEIEELRLIAARGGHGTLSYLLHCAAEEARTQVRLRAAQSTRDIP
jgi:hypothetical protein